MSALDEHLVRVVKKTTLVPNGYAVRKNICYNLHFLSTSLEQLSLSDVLLTQTYKTFIVTGIGVIEAILYFLVKERSLQRTNEWECLKEQKGTPFSHGEGDFRLDTMLLRRRATPIDEDISFERLLRTVEQKKLLGAASGYYAQLHHLRKLRNKVHLFLTDDDLQTDWKAFTFHDMELMKALLLALLTGKPFAPSDLYGFLKPWSSVGVPK